MEVCKTKPLTEPCKAQRQLRADMPTLHSDKNGNCIGFRNFVQWLDTLGAEEPKEWFKIETRDVKNEGWKREALNIYFSSVELDRQASSTV